MKYEKQYVDMLISESIKITDIKNILEDYLLNNIDFETLVLKIEECDIDIIKYRTFKKSLDISELLGE